MMTPAERQRVLDTLGKMFGFPYRPYTAKEWTTAYQQEGIVMSTERTDQGEQTILPGAERSARQAAASRESIGHGKIRPKKPQKDPGGLFAPKEAEQPKLF